MDEPALLPWDRQSNEPGRVYSYFGIYRDMGRTRTVAKVATEVHKSRDYLHKVATTWRWVHRARAFDTEQDRQYGELLGERRKDMAERHARIAAALQGKIVTRLQSLDAQKLTPGDLARWLEVATRVERLALGLPDSTTAHTGPDGGPIQAEVAEMPEDARTAFFRALVAEAQQRAGVHNGREPGDDDEEEEPDEPPRP